VRPARRRSLLSRVVAPVVVGIAALAVVGCDDDGGDDDTAPAASAPADGAPTTTVPSASSRFCVEMLELEDASGTVSELEDAYTSLLPDVPDAVRADFEAVLDRLRLIEVGEDVASPTVVEESALRVSAYVDLNCRGTAQNPLPPPTQPGSETDD
jgi:hypothetical protein